MDANQFRNGLILFIGLIVSVGVHEFGHAFVSHKLGDPTPESEGRVTLNPLAHLDMIGTVILPIFFIFILNTTLMFGWGKPVNINPLRFKKSVSMRFGDILVSFAGPLMNILFAALLLLIMGILVRGGFVKPAEPMLQALGMYVMLNFILAAFNLLPLPPLDGSHIMINSFNMGRRHPLVEFLENYGMWILVILLISGALKYILGPVHYFSISLIRLAIGA
ncbi:site-2 protease family protein [Myxococcota bacterium]|nr:site-2 protease family protein [Myxococcota bacterium]MBU1380276.1 site-2 protease family protein [Myxococcota bacterium]MBU1496388.1 site-2 protease family protein [Myxococcota bacterium]